MHRPIFLIIFLFLGSCTQERNQDAKKNLITPNSLPIIKAMPISPDFHDMVIKLRGEIRPKEKSALSFEHSGKLTYTHPQLIVGGIIHKDEVVAKINDSDILDKIISAEAAVNLATLEYERFRAKELIASRERKLASSSKSGLTHLTKLELKSRLSNLNSAKAELAAAKRHLSDTQLTAPYNLLVLRKTVGLGQVVNSDTVIGEVANIEIAEVHISIPDFNYQYLQQPITETTAIISHDNEIFTTKVDRTLGVVDNKTRMPTIVANYNIDTKNNDYNAIPFQFGQFIDVSLIGSSHEPSIKIENKYVLDNHIWISKGDRLRKIKIDVLYSNDKYTFIKNNFDKKDLLVTKLPQNPLPGMQVKTVTERAHFFAESVLVQ